MRVCAATKWYNQAFYSLVVHTGIRLAISAMDSQSERVSDKLAYQSWASDRYQGSGSADC